MLVSGTCAHQKEHGSRKRLPPTLHPMASQTFRHSFFSIFRHKKTTTTTTIRKRFRPDLEKCCVVFSDLVGGGDLLHHHWDNNSRIIFAQLPHGFTFWLVLSKDLKEEEENALGRCQVMWYRLRLLRRLIRIWSKASKVDGYTRISNPLKRVE